MAASSRHLILISERSEDRRLAEALAAEIGAELRIFNDYVSGGQAILASENEGTLALVDASTEELFLEFHLSLVTGPRGAQETVDASRLHFLGDSALDGLAYLVRSRLFGSYIQRNFGAVEARPARLLGPYFKWLVNDDRLSVASFLAPGSQTKQIKLPSSDQRPMIIEAILKIAQKAGYKERAANRVALAVDELLMNAIFDAPVDSAGRRIYAKTKRSEKLKLLGRSAVEFALSFDGQTLGVMVNDLYGSLEKARFLAHVAKIHTGPGEIMSEFSAGAGIGLATVYQNGCDMFFHCEQGKLTQVALFFRMGNNSREVRSEFRFLGTKFRS